MLVAALVANHRSEASESFTYKRIPELTWRLALAEALIYFLGPMNDWAGLGLSD